MNQTTSICTRSFAVAAACAVTSLASGDAFAGSVLTSDRGYFGYHIGGDVWTQFTAKLDAASGHRVHYTATDFSDLGEMLAYDALLVPARNQGDTLTQAQVNAISGFIATGRRVLLFGENDNWRGWNQQIIGIAGGTYVPEPFDTFWGMAGRVADHEITAGADEILGFWVGVAEDGGGTPLYGPKNFVTLWGGSRNLLTILDENVVEDGYQGTGQDAQFTTNVAVWLAGSQKVPEPAGVALVGAALAVLAIRRSHPCREPVSMR